MLLLLLQTENKICFFCIFILMLGAFLIGYFAKNFNLDFTSKKNKKQKEEKASVSRLKPLGVIKTRERSGSQVTTANDTDS